MASNPRQRAALAAEHDKAMGEFHTLFDINVVAMTAFYRGDIDRGLPSLGLAEQAITWAGVLDIHKAMDDFIATTDSDRTAPTFAATMREPPEPEIPPVSNNLYELSLNLRYCIGNFARWFGRPGRSPHDETAQQRWLMAMAKCETASQEYLAAIRIDGERE